MSAEAAAAPPRGARRRLDLVQLLLNGAGRIGRRTFVAALLPIAGVARWAAAEEGLWSWLLGFAALVTACAVLSKRLHDVARAGWWSAAPVGLLAVASHGEGTLDPAQLAAFVLAVLFVAALALWPGERRFNRFGPAPGAG